VEESDKKESEWDFDSSGLYQEVVRMKNQITVRFNTPGVIESSRTVQIDKRESLAALRVKMAAELDVPADSFKILRSQYSIAEMKDEDGASINSYNLYDNKVHLEKGKPSKPGEFEFKFMHYDPDGEEKMKELWEYSVNENLTARQLKEVLAKRWAEDATAPKTLNPAHLRIREVGSGKEPANILRDDKTLKDGVRVRHAGKSFCLQILVGPDPLQKDTETAIFIQVVEPAKYALGRLVEIVVPNDNLIVDLKAYLQQQGICNDPVLAKPTYSMGIHDIDILQVPDLEWDRQPHMGALNPGSIAGSPYYIREADMLLVKPKGEEWKKLSLEEKAELERQSKKKLATAGTANRYRYREEALKIQKDDD